MRDGEVGTAGCDIIELMVLLFNCWICWTCEEFNEVMVPALLEGDILCGSVF